MASANARTRCDDKIVNDTAVVAFGTYFGAEVKPSPFEKVFLAATFVSGCLYPGLDVMKFLLPDQLKSTKRKSRLELTAKPIKISLREWQAVQATVAALTERNSYINKGFNENAMKRFMKQLREHTNSCQSIYAYLTFALDLRSTSQRETLHQQVMIRLNKPDIRSDAELARRIDRYSPRSINELARGGEFDEVGVTKRVYATRGYTVLLKVLAKHNLTPEEATIEDLQKLADEAKAREIAAECFNGVETTTDTGTDSEPEPALCPAPRARSSTQTTRSSKDTGTTPTPGAQGSTGSGGTNQNAVTVVEDCVSETESNDSTDTTTITREQTIVVDASSNVEDDRSTSTGELDDYSDTESTTTEEGAESDSDLYMPLNEMVATGGTVRRLAKQSNRARARRCKKPNNKPTNKEADAFIDSRNNNDTATETKEQATVESTAKLERKVFDEKWLFNDSTEQHLCFEQPKENCTGTDGPSVFEEIKKGKDKITVLRDRDILAACHDIAVGSMHMYMFNESSHIQHMELTSEESLQLAKLCREGNIAYHYYPREGMSNDSNFIKVAQKGSDEWNKVMDGVRFDAPKVIKNMLNLHENKDKAVAAGSDDKRNSLHYDGGLGCQSWNHDQSPAQAEMTASFPVLIHEPRADHPKEYSYLYHHVGDVLDRLQDYVDRRGQENGNRPMSDDFRTEKAGKKLRQACGAERSRFEAFTIGITIMGTVEEYRKSQSFDKEHKIGRHTDGPNDNRRGYQWTAVFGVLVELEGYIYRLAVIAYMRKSVGDATEKEVQCFQVIKDMLDPWLLNRTTLQDVDLEHDGEEIEHCYDADETKFKEKGRRYPSFADPHGGWAPVIYAIECLGKARTDSPRSFWTELLLVILRHNSPMMMKNIFMRWLPNAAGAKRFDEAIAQGFGPHTIFLIECEHSGILPRNGKCPRMQWSNAGWWPDARNKSDKESIANDIDTLDGILRDAENDLYLHKAIVKRIEKIKGIGPVKALPFYLITTQAGYLTSKHAIRESYFAQLSDKNPGADILKQTGCTNHSLQAAFKRLAWLYELHEYIMENVLCKRFREALFCWDYVAEGQTIYCKTKIRNNMNQERTVFLKKEWNAPWQEYTPKLAGFHNNP